MSAASPRVAIVHYWLVGMRGGERVIERMLKTVPNADIFTHVVDPARLSDTIRARPIRTSFISKLPGATKRYQFYLPLMPMALEELDLSGYDLVISSEAGPAKGVITAPGVEHISYVHSPMRYVWDHYHQYAATVGPVSRMAMRIFYHYLRTWDVASAARVDTILANSSFIQSRVRKVWRREAEVLHPPVEVSAFSPVPRPEVTDRFLWVGQMVAYKRADLAVDAFNELGLPLTMVGDGKMLRELRKRAKPNIEFIDRLSFAQLQQAYARCRALIFTAEEDFGIVPVEANAAGRPVIAYGRGGIRDSILPDRTGTFFPEQTSEALIEAVRAFERWEPHFDPAAAVANARRFAPERFDEGFGAAVARALGRPLAAAA